MMLGMLATLAEYERELITERVNAGIAAAKLNGTKFGRPVNPAVVEEKRRSCATRARRAVPRGRGTVGGLVAGDPVPAPTRRRRVGAGC
jgi:DNA invertase Pin-like site-specific DNA recombinase